jgi:hypothetical protein
MLPALGISPVFHCATYRAASVVVIFAPRHLDAAAAIRLTCLTPMC